jgi:hypothetical protein
MTPEETRMEISRIMVKAIHDLVALDPTITMLYVLGSKQAEGDLVGGNMKFEAYGAACSLILEEATRHMQDYGLPRSMVN